MNHVHTRNMVGGLELATKTVKLMAELSFKSGFVENTIHLASQIL